MTMNQSQRSAPGRCLARAIREHWLLFVVEGIVLVILGLLAVLVPPLATLGVTIFLGWLFLVSGIMGLIATFWARQAPGFWWSLVSARCLASRAGLDPACQPGERRGFANPGADRVLRGRGRRLGDVRAGPSPAALGPLGLDAVQRADRSHPCRHDPVGLPGTAAWAIGLLVGINMIFGGSALIAMGLHARNSSA